MYFKINCISRSGNTVIRVIKLQDRPLSSNHIIKKMLLELNHSSKLTDQYSYVIGSWKETDLDNWMKYINNKLK